MRQVHIQLGERGDATKHVCFTQYFHKCLSTQSFGTARRASEKGGHCPRHDPNETSSARSDTVARSH